MANLAKFFKTDKTVEAEGQWFRISLDNGETVGVHMSRPWDQNPKYQMAYERLVRTRGLQHRIDKGKLRPDEQLSLIRDASIEGCMNAFEDFEMPWGSDGGLQSVEFSVENAKRVFDECPGLYRELLGMAVIDASWLEVDREEAAKN